MANNQITVIDEVRGALTRMEPQFKAALPKHVTPDRFLRITMTAVQGNPKLLECNRTSLYAACMKAAQDGLLPDGREGAIIPRKGVAQWQVMVAGVMKKVRNSGEISTWSVHTVHENDDFEYVLGDDERITHRPALKNRGALIGAYSIVLMKDGERSREYMGEDEILSIRDRSDGYRYAKSKGSTDNPWITDPGEMYKKTVIRRHSKRLPMSTDLDEMLRDDDHQFTQQPSDPVQHAEPQAEAAPAKRTRPSRLQTVVDQAPPAHTEDGEVIEHEPQANGYTPASEFNDYDESPI
jgi:recombination protein RecT